MSKEAPLKCLWLDLKSSTHVEETPSQFANHCEIVRVVGFDDGAVDHELPDFVVVEFDFPSRQDMARACAFKQAHPNVPMVVITVQHSEALAVWFFRARFYDFLVQPLSVADTSRCLSGLKDVRCKKSRQPRREVAKVKTEVPNEALSRGTVPANLQPALSFVERNYHQRLRVSDVAQECGLPEFRFGREFKQEFGVAFRDYVLRYRVREACRLLRNPRAAVTEVGYAVGFSEPSYFTKAFKKLVGLVPSEAVGLEGLELRIDGAVASANYQRSLAKS